MENQFSLITVFNSPEHSFQGNVSAVVFLDETLSDERFQKIASDFNQPATTFLWPSNSADQFHVRWFAPDAEIGLCGHGSMAAIAFLHEKFPDKKSFSLKYEKGGISGEMANSNSCSIWLDPIPVIEEQEPFAALTEGLGVSVEKYFTTKNKHLVLLSSESDLANMKPNFSRLRDSDVFGYTVTAPGNEVDFVSRTLVPHVQQLEDHATGSSHAVLTPFWAERLNKSQMVAHQLSARGGKFICSLDQGTVKLTGQYAVLAKGTVAS